MYWQNTKNLICWGHKTLGQLPSVGDSSRDNCLIMTAFSSLNCSSSAKQDWSDMDSRQNGRQDLELPHGILLIPWEDAHQTPTQWDCHTRKIFSPEKWLEWRCNSTPYMKLPSREAFLCSRFWHNLSRTHSKFGQTELNAFQTFLVETASYKVLFCFANKQKIKACSLSYACPYSPKKITWCNVNFSAQAMVEVRLSNLLVKHNINFSQIPLDQLRTCTHTSRHQSYRIFEHLSIDFKLVALRCKVRHLTFLSMEVTQVSQEPFLIAGKDVNDIWIFVWVCDKNLHMKKVNLALYTIDSNDGVKGRLNLLQLK